MSISKKGMSPLQDAILGNDMTRGQFVRLVQRVAGEVIPAPTMRVYCAGTLRPGMRRGELMAGVMERWFTPTLAAKAACKWLRRKE